MSIKKYVNAEHILPRELLKEVQKHHSGILWIPAPGSFYKERRQLVIALKSQGIETDEIASLAGITRRRVNQILADHRKETDARQVEDSSGM
jgi:predicted transcriptional regulator